MKYTFSFDTDEQNKFKEILSRLEPGEFEVIEDIHPVEPMKDNGWNKRQTIMTMEPEAALTFRLGMRVLKIRKERTEEELAEEKRLDDLNTVKITVKVDGLKI